jgi:hypothetical protein
VNWWHTEKEDPEAPEKCTKPSVRIAAKNAKFHSSQILADQSTAENAGRREENQEDIDFRFITEPFQHILNIFSQLTEVTLLSSNL